MQFLIKGKCIWKNKALVLKSEQFNDPQFQAGVCLVSLYHCPSCNCFNPVLGKRSVMMIFLKGASCCTRHLGSDLLQDFLPLGRARERRAIICCEQEITLEGLSYLSLLL